MLHHKAFLSICCLLCINIVIAKPSPQLSNYEIRVYHCTSNEQIARLDEYFKISYLPALHKEGLMHIGVFKPITNDTASDKKVYVLIPLKSLKQFAELDQKIESILEKSDFQNSAFDHPPYERRETILLKAFEKAIGITLPKLTGNASDRIYELRSYEAPTEKLFRKKVDMFNAGDEIGLFASLNFNAIFYAEVLSGSKMPNLMYMTSFNSIQDRDEKWKIFGSNATWKKLSGLPEYQHTVSKADIILMHATDYSEIQ